MQPKKMKTNKNAAVHYSDWHQSVKYNRNWNWCLFTDKEWQKHTHSQTLKKYNVKKKKKKTSAIQCYGVMDTHWSCNEIQSVRFLLFNVQLLCFHTTTATPTTAPTTAAVATTEQQLLFNGCSTTMVTDFDQDVYQKIYTNCVVISVQILLSVDHLKANLNCSIASILPCRSFKIF